MRVLAVAVSMVLAVLLACMSVYASSTPVVRVVLDYTGDAWVYEDIVVDDVPTVVYVKTLGEPYIAEAVDDNGKQLPLNYTVDTIAVQVYDNTTVHLKYYASIAEKHGKIWVINTTVDKELELVMPPGAVTLYVSPDPLQIRYEDSRAHMVFEPGKILVEYMVYMATETRTATTQQATGTEQPVQNTNTQQIPATTGEETSTKSKTVTGNNAYAPGVSILVPAVIIAVATATILYTITRHKKKTTTQILDNRDKQILETLKKHGGQATATQIMQWTNIPKTPLYRRLEKLTKLGYIETIGTGKTRIYRIKKQ